MYGYGVSCDAGHITAPDKDGVGAAYAMSQAIKDAQVNPSDVDYINAHGTSTPLGDVAETIGMKSVFQEHARRLSISSTKSQLGHLLGASGGVELILSLLAIRDGVIPPTINLDTPDPECDLDYTPNQPRQRDFSGHVEQFWFRRPQRVAGVWQAAQRVIAACDRRGATRRLLLVFRSHPS